MKFIIRALKHGFVFFLPLLIIVIIVYFIMKLISPLLLPTITLFKLEKHSNNFFSLCIFIVVLLSVSFFVGVFIRTKVGKMLYEFIETILFNTIPGYKLLKEMFLEFRKHSVETLINRVALVRLYQSNTQITGFIVDESEHYFGICFLSGGNPGIGLVNYVEKSRVIELKGIKGQQAFRTLIGFGVSSKALLETSYIQERAYEKNC